MMAYLQVLLGLPTALPTVLSIVQRQTTHAKAHSNLLELQMNAQ